MIDWRLMIVNLNELKFSETSILPIISSSDWTFEGAVVDGSTIVISPGGHAKCVPTQTILNRVFRYFKIEIDYINVGISSISNFKNLPYCFIVETYKNDNNEIYRNRARCLGFNTFNPIDVESSRYIDTTIFGSMNKELGYYSIDIRNNSQNTLTINKINVFTSIDISPNQVGDVINQVNSASDPNGFKVYCDENYEKLNGLAVTLTNSTRELKYKPIYNLGLLGEIKTNFGIDYPVVYVPEEIDIDN